MLRSTLFMGALLVLSLITVSTASAALYDGSGFIESIPREYDGRGFVPSYPNEYDGRDFVPSYPN